MLAVAPYESDWRGCADLEMQFLQKRMPKWGRRELMIAHFHKEKGQLDGKLLEPVWKGARKWTLLPFSPAPPASTAVPGASVQVIRSPTHLLLGVRLGAAAGRVWTVQVAIDSDRDAWTQLLLACSTRGERSARLVRRLGPDAKADLQPFLVQGTKGPKEYTLEMAVPLALTGTDPARGGYWNFQVIATAKDYGRSRVLYFRPQPDSRWLPERYGLLCIPALPRDAAEPR